MIAWRICKAKRKATALSGEGAAKFPGRWNSAGRHVVYLGESRSLAALEVLVHAEDLSVLNAIRWVAIPVEFDPSLVSVPIALPAGWDAVPAPSVTHRLGDEWLDGKHSLILRVPSVVTKGEFNYLVNPAHPDFAKLTIHPAEPYRFDQRIAKR